MRHSTILCAVGLALMSYVPAYAQTLPTSENPTTGNWTKMNPSSFSGTITSAHSQCERAARIDDSDRLTLEHCLVLEHKLTNGLCSVEMVRDGMSHDLMNGRVNGSSRVTTNVRKQLGREDRALLCGLGEGVYGYWYTGTAEQSCNNVAFTFTAVIPRDIPEDPPKQGEPLQYEMVRVCDRIPFATSSPGYEASTSGYLLENSCGPAFYSSGSTTRFTGTSGSGYTISNCRYEKRRIDNEDD